MSGDGAFADVVAELAARGVPTTVVAQPERLSARLRLAACAVVEVPKPPTFEVDQPNFAADPATVVAAQETLAAFEHVRHGPAGLQRVIDPITRPTTKSAGNAGRNSVMTTKAVVPQVPEGFRLDPGGKLILAIDEIVVGDRHRTDLGDIQKLKNSIDDVGQLQPVVVTAERRLIAGYRRIAALKLLGMDEAEVTIAANVDDALSGLKAERDENTCRKGFTKLEATALAKAIREIEAPKAEERKRHGKKTNEPPPNLGEGGRTDAKVAAVTGIKPETQRKIDKITRLALDHDAPEIVREAALAGYETMKADDTAAVHPLYQAVIAAENAAKAAEADTCLTGSESTRACTHHDAHRQRRGGRGRAR